MDCYFQVIDYMKIDFFEEIKREFFLVLGGSVLMYMFTYLSARAGNDIRSSLKQV